jgi:glutamyl-tRNA synthetase
MNYQALAELLFPNIKTTPADMEARYPKRDLPEGAKVTRFAPSPTGFVHFGGLFPTRISERLAHQSNGVFYLRIEDTDAKRKVEGAEANLIEVYRYYGIHFDEGVTENGEIGAYGPYRQSERAEIYHTFAKDLVLQGKAYPCFCTEEEVSAIRAEQEAQKLTPGYYGKWAVWRDASIEQIEAKLAQKTPFVLRFRSEGDASRKVKFTDLIKGNIEVTENEIDHVLLKSDGIPTYHFAHAVDDHLMGTTHVVRCEEWLPSLPFHLQLFQALGFKMPKYLHISQLMKLEGGSKKKLSKRNNEASMQFYKEAGYPPQSVVEYIMTLLNSNYEEWRMQNTDKDFCDFPFSIKKMSPSGCLFDFDKLNDVSKNTISRMSADQVYAAICAWAKEFDPEFYALLAEDADYAKKILSIGRGIPKPRKDLTTWRDARPYMALFYDALFARKDAMPNTFAKEDIASALQAFLASYDPSDDMNTWFSKIKEIAQSLGFAPETKLYKQNPQDYKGHVGDVSAFIRIALTGQVNSPDLYTVMQILGTKRVNARIADAIALL